MFTKELVRLKIIPISFKHSCICCGKANENLEHILLECERFKDVRKKIFPHMKEFQELDEVSKNKLIKKHLGGELVTSRIR